jgi:hypothetical protein
MNENQEKKMQISCSIRVKTMQIFLKYYSKIIKSNIYSSANKCFENIPDGTISIIKPNRFPKPVRFKMPVC